MFEFRGFSILRSLLFLPGRFSSWARAGVVLGITLVYALLFSFFYPPLGSAASGLSVLPVAAGACLFGLRGGLICGLLVLPLSLLLASLIGAENWTAFLDQGGWLSWLAALLAGILVGLFSDLNRRLQVDETSRRMNDILEATTDLVAEAWPDGRLFSINQAGRKMLGIEPNEPVHTIHLGDFQSPQTRERMLNTGLPAALREGLWAGESRLVSRSGREIPVHQLIVAHRLAGGQAAYLTTIVRDISELKQAEQSEREQRILAGALRDTLVTINESLNFEEVLEQILVNVERVVPHDMASIGLIEGNLVRVTRYRSPASIQSEGRGLPSRLLISETPNLRSTLETKKPLIIPNIHQDPLWVHYPESEWVRSHISVPICVQGDVIGFLTLDSAAEGFYNEKQAAALQAFADQAAAALHNARLLAEAERRAGEFAVLVEMAGDLATLPDLSPLLGTLIERATALLDAPGGEIFLFDPVGSYLELAVIQGLPLQPGLRMEIGEGLAGRVALTRQSLIINDYHAWKHRLTVPGVEEVTAALGVPMLYRGELVGVLVVFESEVRREFTEAQARLLSLFASQAASAVHNTRLFQETRHRLAEMEAINKVSNLMRQAQTVDEMLQAVLEEILSVLDIQAGIIWMFDNQKKKLSRCVARDWFIHYHPGELEPGEGMAGKVFQTGLPLVAAEFVSDPQTRDLMRGLIPAGWGGAGVPIRTNQTIVGVLLVSVPLPRLVTESELHLLATLADMAGNAVHRASLHEQTQKHLHRLSALHTIDMTINASLDLSIVFGILLDQALLQLQVDAARILALDPHTQTLEYTAGRGFHAAVFSSSQRLSQGLSGRVVLDRRLLLIPNLEAGDLHDPNLLSTLGPMKSEGFAAYCGVPLIAKGQIKGVLEIFQRSPLNPDPDWLDFVETLAGQAAMAIENSSLFNDLQRSNLELTLAYDTTIEGWSRALDLRDKETEGHALRVTDATIRLARAMGVSESEMVHIRRGALLHDIGKMGIPDGILLKPGPLDDQESAIMRMHPIYARELLSQIPFLRRAVDIPYAHHEKWDGSGYPRGLEGEQIPLPARIFAVIDVWDALCSDRPYRPAWPEEKARRYILEQSGRHFDPRVVDAFQKSF